MAVSPRSGVAVTSNSKARHASDLTNIELPVESA